MAVSRHSITDLRNAHSIICQFLKDKNWVKKESILLELSTNLTKYKRSTIDRLLRAVVHYSQETHDNIDVIISSERGYKIATLSTELFDESQKRRQLATTYEDLALSLSEKSRQLRAKEGARLQTA